MTTTTENKETKPKKPADFYIFEATGDGKQNKIVGRAYKHGKGNGMNVLIGGKRYAVFPAKTKPAEAAATEGASA